MLCHVFGTAGLQVFEQDREDGFVVFGFRGSGEGQGFDGAIHGDDGTRVHGFLDFGEALVDRVGIRAGGFREGDHPAPDESVVGTLEQFNEVFDIATDQRGVNVTDFVQRFDAIRGDIRVLVPQMLGNFADAGAVFFGGQVAGEFPVGDFVTAVLEMGEAVEDGHGDSFGGGARWEMRDRR